MLKMKQSQVLNSMIDGVGAVALGIWLFKLTGWLWFGYLFSGLMLALSAWIVIKIQANKHTNASGYLNIAVFLLNLAWIGLAFHWFVPVGLFVVFVWVGFRFVPKPTIEPPSG